MLGDAGADEASKKFSAIIATAKWGNDMTPKTFVFLCILGLATAFSGAGHAIDKPNQPTAVRPTKLSPTKLTKSECTELGGSVTDLHTAETANICNSGWACKTTDQNGKNHMVCINSQ